MESRAPEGRQAAGGGSQSGAGWNSHVCDQTILAWWGRAWAGGGLTQPHLPCTPTPTHPPNSRQAPPEDSRPVRGLLNGGHHHKACVRAETSRPQSLQVGRALPPTLPVSKACPNAEARGHLMLESMQGRPLQPSREPSTRALRWTA